MTTNGERRGRDILEIRVACSQDYRRVERWVRKQVRRGKRRRTALQRLYVMLMLDCYDFPRSSLPWRHLWR